jgi:hypothetical protein
VKLVDVHVVPNARRDEIVGVHDGRLRVRVRAPAVDGKANAALCRVVAEHFRVRASKVTIVRGEHARQKTLRVEGA